LGRTLTTKLCLDTNVEITSQNVLRRAGVIA
jgi:hypothetical protein